MIQHLFAAGLGSTTVDEVLPCMEAPLEEAQRSHGAVVRPGGRAPGGQATRHRPRTRHPAGAPHRHGLARRSPVTNGSARPADRDTAQVSQWTRPCRAYPLSGSIRTQIAVRVR
ncbi:hypothetical protein LV779_12735 [Streptomyces thinghirensis]|nr:hypothetical protein [Streptomyces thinghirensis]